MKLKLKKINVLKLSFFMALFYSILSIFIFLFMAIISAVSGQAFAWWMIFIAPVIYGIAGFAGGLMMGGLYNLVSKWIGGLEFEFEEIEKFSE